MRKQLRKCIIPLEKLKADFQGYSFQNCLDVGSGTALWPEFLLENNIIKFCQGVEIYPKYFQKGANYEISSEKEIPSGAKYDLISFFDVLHHVGDKEKFIKDYLLKYGHENTVVFIKEMSPRHFFYKSMNRLHDLVMARQIISEITVDELKGILGKDKIIKYGEEQIYWYDHYWCFFRNK